MNERIIKVEFRWPVEQLTDRTIEVHIPLGPGGPLLLAGSGAKEIGLTEVETADMMDVAYAAALRAIMIKK